MVVAATQKVAVTAATAGKPIWKYRDEIALGSDRPRDCTDLREYVAPDQASHHRYGARQGGEEVVAILLPAQLEQQRSLCWRPRDQVTAIASWPMGIGSSVEHLEREHFGQNGVILVPRFSKLRGYTPRGGWHAVAVRVGNTVVAAVTQLDSGPIWIPLRSRRQELGFYTEEGRQVHRLNIAAFQSQPVVVSFRSPRRNWHGQLIPASWTAK